MVGSNVLNIKEIQVCSRQGSAGINEDVLIVNHKDRIYGVIDGATSVTPYRNQQGQTGGYLASNLLGTYLGNVPVTKSLKDVVLEANDALRGLMIKSGINITSKMNLWCAVFAIFRINEYSIEYVQTGDCMLFGKYNYGVLRPITISQVSHLDAISIKKRMEARQLGYTTNEQIFHYVLPTIRNNRMKSNTREGYSVMNGEPEFADYLEYGFFNRACLTKLYALTDGLFYPTANPDITIDWNETISRIDTNGIVAYADELFELERSDLQCLKYPRHKISDDKTGIVIHLHY